MRQVLQFCVACLAVIALAWALAVLLFPGVEVRSALNLAAVVAAGVQLVTFLVARALARRNVMAGWGIGVALRFGALAIVALVVVPRLGLPLAASLLGLATFLFVSTLIEPLFLKQ